MFSRRTIFDFAFFAGAFLIIESLVAYPWWDLPNIGEVNGFPISVIQVTLLLVGIISMSGSVIFVNLLLKGIQAGKRLLPSTRLFADFSFIIGAFFGLTAVWYYGPTCIMICGFNFFEYLTSLLLAIFSPVLIGTSIFLWRRVQVKNRSYHKVGWEIFSTISISILLFACFILPGDTFWIFWSNPLIISIGIISAFGLIFGLRSISLQERKIAADGLVVDPLKNYSTSSLRLLLVLISIAAILAAGGLSILIGSNTNNCGGGFGIYGCNVQTITLSSVILNNGTTASYSSVATSSLVFALNNPHAETTISSLTLTGYGFSQITSWSTTTNGKNLINFQSPYSKDSGNAVNSSSISTFTLFPFANQTENIVRAQVYNYVIGFSNGQMISGSLIAQ